VSIEEAFISRLESSSALAALIGGAGAQRIYPVAIPADPVFPMLVYLVVSGEHGAHLEGVAGEVEVRLQLNAFGFDYLTLKSVHEQARLILMNTNWWNTTTAGVWVYGTRIEDERDIRNPPEVNEDVELYGVSRDYLISYQESVP
jgi:hypothetical protein